MDCLQKELMERQRRNLRYSLRSFARDLEVSPSWLSDVLHGKKGLSEKRSQSICRKLKYSRTKTKLFVSSSQAKFSRSQDLKQKFKLELQTELQYLHASRDLNSKELKEADLPLFSNWICYAILELFEISGFVCDAGWMARRLGLEKHVIESYLSRMLEKKVLVPSPDGLKPSTQESETSTDIPSTWVQHYHADLLKKASKILKTQPVQKREFINMTLAFDSGKLPEAKLVLREFQREFADRFYSAQSQKDSVYQLSIQLFPLDRDFQQRTRK